MFWLKYPLREEKAEGGEGGGAGGGAGEGAGAGAGGGTALTLEAMTALMNTTVNNAINGAVAKIEKRLEKVEKPVTPPVVTPPATQGTGAGASESEKLAQTKLDEAIARLATVEEERKAEKLDAANRLLEAEIKTSLSDFAWDPSQGGKEIAFDYYKGRAKRGEDGRIMIGDVELSKFVKEQVPRQFKGMLAARQVGGAGAQQGSGQNGSNKPIDISEIGVGMSKEKQDQAVRDIAAALQSMET